MEKKKRISKAKPKSTKKTTKKVVKKKSKKKGFTLIELLAVIIILGVLMIIAIPAVTSYISNSRKSAYVNTAQNIVAGARTKVNDGTLGMYDTDTTYYIPYGMIKGENELKSPYGAFTAAYVVVTFNGKSYDYYWTSVDTTKTGMYLTYSDLLDTDRVVNDITGISTSIGIGNRSKIVIFDDNGNKTDGVVEDYIYDKDNYVELAVNECTYNGTLTAGVEYINGDYTYAYKRRKTESGWSSIGEDGWGVMLTDKNATSATSPLCTSINGKPIVSMAYMYYNAKDLEEIDVSSFDTRNVAYMHYMFYNAGYNSSNFVINGLSVFKTGNVREMNNMFYQTGYSSQNLDISRISTWNVANVIGMNAMFTGMGYNTSTITLDLSHWNTSKVTNFDLIFSRTGYNASKVNINLSGWDLRGTNSLSNAFKDCGYNANEFALDVSRWNVSNIENMYYAFSGAGYSATNWSLRGLPEWDVSSVTSMNCMFKGAGAYANVWEIGDLSGWDISSATDMRWMFDSAGRYSTKWENVGTLKTYNTDIGAMFQDCPNANITLEIHNNPTNYGYVFNRAATATGSLITINYSSSVTNIDAIIATKNSNSNIVKGSVID